MGSGLAAPFNFYGGAYPGTGGTCAVTLSAGATCTIMVDFSPVTTGVNSDSITLDYNDGVNLQQATRDIQGTGI
jgi:glutamate-1-semialdehyde aminotransferase